MERNTKVLIGSAAALALAGILVYGLSRGKGAEPVEKPLSLRERKRLQTKERIAKLNEEKSDTEQIIDPMYAIKLFQKELNEQMNLDAVDLSEEVALCKKFLQSGKSFGELGKPGRVIPIVSLGYALKQERYGNRLVLKIMEYLLFKTGYELQVTHNKFRQKSLAAFNIQDYESEHLEAYFQIVGDYIHVQQQAVNKAKVILQRAGVDYEKFEKDVMFHQRTHDDLTNLTMKAVAQRKKYIGMCLDLDPAKFYDEPDFPWPKLSYSQMVRMMRTYWHIKHLVRNDSEKYKAYEYEIVTTSKEVHRHVQELAQESFRLKLTDDMFVFMNLSIQNKLEEEGPRFEIKQLTALAFEFIAVERMDKMELPPEQVVTLKEMWQQGLEGFANSQKR